ncbi:MAG: tetratricopeptide repeat protein [Methanothrix sp.]
MVFEMADISSDRGMGDGGISPQSREKIRVSDAPRSHLSGSGPEASASRRASILLIILLLGTSLADGEELFASDWTEMGNAQAGRGELREAVRSYDRAIAIDAYNPDIWYNRGLALSRLGEYEEALRCYQRATNLRPFDPDIWRSRGAVLSSLGRYEDALESYDRATEFGSRDAEAWNNRGTVLAALGRYGEAIDSYDRAIQLRPGDADAWNNKGSALHQMGRYQEAIDCYDRAIGLDPLHRYAWHNKGLLFPTLDEGTKDAFALLRKRIYVETEAASLPLLEGRAALMKAEGGMGGGRVSGWIVSMAIAAVLVTGLLFKAGGKRRASYRDYLQSSLNRLALIGDRSLRRRLL